MATTVSKPESRPMTEEADFLQIKSIDHVHFYVGNAKQAMYYWWKALASSLWPIPGWRPATANLLRMYLQSGQARFVVSAAYSPTHEIGCPSHGAWRRRKSHRPGSG